MREDVEDPLLAFGAEREPVPALRNRRARSAFQTWLAEVVARARDEMPAWLTDRRSRTARLWALASIAGVLTAATGYLLWNRFARATAPPAAIETGIATINSRPEGLLVSIDGEVRGRTPLKLALALGSHTLQVQGGAEDRTIPLVIEPGTTVSQYVDLGPATIPPSTGRLEIVSEPPGAPVRVDGKMEGNAPLALPAVAVGEHTVVVGNGDAAVKRSVVVLPGATASIVASTSQPAATAGWVALKAPFDMQVFEGGRLIGTTGVDRIMLPTGAHKLELVNTALDFRTTTSVQVAAGATANATVAVPNGMLSVNALPWAEVEIDGRPMGTTPLANIALPIGSHEVVWKHPQRGERRRTVAVTANAPARVGVDFNQ